MYICSIHIEGFGIFNDQHIDIPSPGLTIIEGLNEAGKTTLLAFTRGMLFGFEDSRSNRNRYLPLRGGRYGGHIVVTLANGEKYHIERIGERSRGQVTIRLPDGTREGQEVLDHILAGATRDLYRNIFGFGLEELQQLGTLHDEAVRMRIYSAGTGTGSMSLLQVDNRLQKKMGELFKERGTTQEINKLFNDLDNVQAKLRELRSQTDQYDKLQQNLKQITQEIDGLENKRGEWRRKLSRTENLLKAWNSWVKFQWVYQQLGELPEIPDFPADGVKRLDSLTEALDNLREQHRRERKSAEDAEAECSKLVIDWKLLNNQEQIQRLAEEMAKFDSASKDLPKVKAECENEETSLQNALAQLGPDWDEEKMSDFNASIPEREIIRHFEERLRKAQDDLRDTTKIREQAEEVARKANSEIKEAEEDFQKFPQPSEKNWLTFEAKDAAIRKLRTLKEQLNRAQYELENAVLIREQNEEIVKKADREGKEAEEEFQKFPEPFEKDWSAFEVKNAAIRRLKTIFSKVGQLETEKRHLEERKEELESQRNSVKGEISKEIFILPLWCAVPLLFLGFILIFWFWKEKNIELAVISGFLFFLLAGLCLWFRARLSQEAQNRRHSMEDEYHRLSDKLQSLDLMRDKNEKEYIEYQKRLYTELAALDRAGIETEDALEEVTAEVERNKEYLRKWEGLKDKEEEARRRLQNATETLKTATDREENCKQRLEQVKATFFSELAKLGKTDMKIEDVLEEVTAEVERNKEHLRKWEGLKDKEEEARRRLQNATEALKTATDREESCKQILKQVEEEWRIWLESRQLKTGLSPDGVLEVFSAIEKARESLKLVRSLRQRVKDMKSYIKDFRERAYTLLIECGRALSDFTKLSEALDRLVSDLKQAITNSTRLEELTKEVKKYRDNLELLEKRLTEKEREKKQLMELGGADDEEDFRNRAKVYEERHEFSVGEQQSNSIYPFASVSFVNLAGALSICLSSWMTSWSILTLRGLQRQPRPS